MVLEPNSQGFQSSLPFMMHAVPKDSIMSPSPPPHLQSHEEEEEEKASKVPASEKSVNIERINAALRM